MLCKLLHGIVGLPSTCIADQLIDKSIGGACFFHLTFHFLCSIMEEQILEEQPLLMLQPVTMIKRLLMSVVSGKRLL